MWYTSANTIALNIYKIYFKGMDLYLRCAQIYFAQCIPELSNPNTLTAPTKAEKCTGTNSKQYHTIPNIRMMFSPTYQKKRHAISVATVHSSTPIIPLTHLPQSEYGQMPLGVLFHAGLHSH